MKVTASLFFAASYTASAQDGDWISNWTSPRTLESAFDVDPGDARSTMRGSGDIVIGDGLAKFYGSPRLYISHDDPTVEGWDDVEITAYGKYVNQGKAPFKSYSGLTLVTRSNHDEYASDGCSAFSYYARIYQETGECAFQKEYFHGNSSNEIFVGTVYSNSRRRDCFAGGLPLDQWVGLKFKAKTIPGTKDVLLELWVDYNDDGNWELGLSYTDTPGDWPCSTSKVVPSECAQNNGDTITRPGNVSFLRTDGVDTNTEVHWRDVTITNSVPTSAPVPTNPPTTAAPTTAKPTSSPTPLNCGTITSKGTCNNNSRCTWDGNPNSGECVSIGGGEGPSPTPPPTQPTGTGCATCGNGDNCCAPQSCETSGASWRRACV